MIDPAPPLTISAPGSMRPVQESLRAGFAKLLPGVEVRFITPNHSGILAQQILAGEAADVFISAGWRYVLELHEAGLLPQPEVIAGNRLALLVRPDLDPPIQQVADLARPGLRAVVPPEESDPLGQYTAELFSLAGMTEMIAEKRARGETVEHLRGVQAGMSIAGIDAAVIYATMREMLGAAGTCVPLPPPCDLSDRIVFGAGVIDRPGRTHPAASQFVAFLMGSPGQALLTQAGFLPRAHAQNLI